MAIEWSSCNWKENSWMELSPSSSDLQIYEVKPDVTLQTERITSEIVPGTACPLHCAVCGAFATGYHYDAPSCNSCKAFFRRTIISGRKYVCRLGENRCNLEKDARRDCRACRFTRCISAGMNAALIEDCTAVAVKGEKTSDDQGAVRSSKVPTKVRLAFSLSSDERILEDLNYLQSKAERLRCSSFDPPREDFTLLEILTRNSEISNAEKYKIPSDWPIPQPPPTSMKQVLLMKQKCLGESNTPCNHFAIIRSKRWPLCDIIVSIEYAKAFSCFQDLSLEDKVTLLRNVAAVNTALTGAYYAYEQKSDMMVFPDGIRPLLLHSDPCVLEVEINTKVMEPLLRCQLDRNEYVLLQAIALTHAGNAHLSEEGRKRLEKECNKYAEILLKYTQNRFGVGRGAQRFAETVSLVETFVHQASKRREFHVYLSMILGKKTWTLMDELLLC